MPETSELIIEENVSYIFHPDHRNNTYGKSQWIISLDEEVNCFRKCYDEEWIVDQKGWGLHIVDHRVLYLGVDQPHENKVFLAKFIDGNKNQKWHGYPVDHQRSSADIPDTNILNKWLETSVLTPPKIRKILKGQPCNL